MFGGIAKDLVKLGGKTVTKLVTPAEKSTRLFKLVSLLTGWKNSLKGVGYFAGSALVAVQYELALAVMMGLIVVALPIATFGLDARLGTASKNNAKCSDVFITHNPNLNWLSLARCFLFASRDFWFEVPLPFFLRSPRCDGLGSAPCLIDSDCNGGAICLNMTAGSFDRVDSPLLSSPCAGPFSPVAAGDEGAAFTAASGAVCVNTNVGGGCGGLGWDRVVVGAILASYIIIYGQCQSYTPQLITGPLKQTPPNKLTETLWGCFNCIPTAVLAAVVYNFPSGSADAPLAAWLMAAIVCFALIFAVNSSIHSFLVVHYAKADKLATSVGFYYMSNAVGRLVGTLGSGVIYTYAGERYGALSGSDARAGLAACFVAGTISSVLAAVITLKIRDEAAGLRCGPCVCVAKEEQREESDAHGPPGTGTRPSAATTAAEVEQSQSSQSVSGDVVLVAGEGTASQC